MRRIEQFCDRVCPQIAMPRQAQVKQAEGRHQGRVMPGQKMGVFAQVHIAGWQMLYVVVRGGRRRSFGIFHERRLQLVGDHAQFVAAHVQEGIDARFNGNFVGSGNEFAVRYQTHLVGACNDPLRIRRRQIMP